jgi:MFS family permease
VLRDVFPASEASWRIPIWFFSNICGMALGGWLAGYIYDLFGSYGPAFMMGVVLNLANIAIIWLLAARRSEAQASPATSTSVPVRGLR